ncbi:MAG TPA: response regulator [Steroidobacteraceae bacterium]
MRDRATSSWRRLSDEFRDRADPDDIRRPLRMSAAQAQQVQSWESEGGRSAFLGDAARILIVDTDIAAADSLERMLHASAYSQTRVAYSGEAALAIAAEYHPDVALLELDLLDSSGYQVAQLLREQAQSGVLRMIALTSSREHAGRERARVAGFERYLLKPIAALDLSELLRMPPA